MLKKISKKGFTIVETLIVLVVAGVIIGIVIVAAGGLNTSSKNSAIKKDAANMLSAFTDFVNNNNGAVATGATLALPGGISKNITSDTIVTTVPAGAGVTAGATVLSLYNNYSCGTNGATTAQAAAIKTLTANTGHQAVIYPILNGTGGVGSTGCISN